MLNDDGKWAVTFTRANAAGREIGRYASMQAAMLAAQAHFRRETGTEIEDEDDELGWQMAVGAATALSTVGVYRVIRSDMRRR